ncbi:MAG TPA: aminofutalosine synthase MqnE [Planctomycetaceae bacterium]|jgi:aminodeoxyfutalosine synthase|nr:aminofutalosine synthase MqnE [Pirellulales bacterium]HAL12664.1 aminofutalosine synthase MqnE [Planctomycetaceae bacterium]HCP84714.1 aminofutalosine synthase MqnE [Planctomycetaceae bacterium]|tara:strand:- start:300 stop:1454 length:1155 start_codon:yes stop_codon:yes gene_type:complete
MASNTPTLDSIARKVEDGERLSMDDGLFLYDDSTPLHEIGQLANLVRERINGNVAYYNINTHLNPTNICVYRCNFCAFRADLRDPRGYVMDDEQILARGAEAVDNGCTEIHIVGGLHHQKKFDWYLNLVKILHDAYPQLHLKAWTGVEINWFEFLTRQPVRIILEQLREAGLGSMPGGGAEIFHPEVRDRICEHKSDAHNWLNIHRTAHDVGIKTNCTMLYGHIENAYHRVDHLIRLRELQDQTGGFQTFIPLAFHPENTELGEENNIKKPSSLMDLRTVAVSRLMLDNVPHIKAYWIMLGIGTAQTALSYGADDLDGTVRHELIYHDAGATTPELLTVDRLEDLIREAGRDPVERDTVYNHVHRDAEDPTKWTTGEPITLQNA